MFSRIDAACLIILMFIVILEKGGELMDVREVMKRPIKVDKDRNYLMQ